MAKENIEVIGTVRESLKDYFTIADYIKSYSLSLFLAQKLYESGKISTEDYISQINSGEIIFNYEILCDLWKDGFEAINTTIDLLPKLAESTNLFMLSNTNDIHFTSIEKKFKISHYFQKLVLSYQVGCRKPEPDIYIKALQIVGATTENAYFVDDLAKNVHAARNAGITAHQYTNYESFYNFLQINSLI